MQATRPLAETNVEFQRPSWIERTARFAGGLYIVIFPVSAFGMLYVPSVLVVRGDAAATARNIIGSDWLFRSAIVSRLVSQILLVCLALALYQLFKPIKKSHAVLMVVLALLGASIACVNEVNHLAVLRLLSGADYLTPFVSAQLDAQAMLFLALHDSGILVAQVFWASGSCLLATWSSSRGLYLACWEFC